MLDALDVTIQPFLNEPTFIVKSNISEPEGIIWIALASLAPAPPASGNGTLALITFNVTHTSLYAENVGCVLNLYDTALGDSNAQPIEHAVADGYYAFRPGDVALYDVKPSKTVVGQGLTMHINATAANEGGYTETFNVTAYYNATNPIATQAITLASGDYITIAFTWNATGFAKGNYTISAVADTVLGETDTADNNFTDGWVIVAMVGDVSGPDGWPDGKVNIMDLTVMAKIFGVNYPDPRYNANYDLNDDGKINIADLTKAAKHFGETDP